jgi:hypothetical protein
MKLSPLLLVGLVGTVYAAALDFAYTQSSVRDVKPGDSNAFSLIAGMQLQVKAVDSKMIARFCSESGKAGSGSSRLRLVLDGVPVYLNSGLLVTIIFSFRSVPSGSSITFRMARFTTFRWNGRHTAPGLQKWIAGP